MQNEEYRSRLLELIPRAKPASGMREVQCRCRYCSDSRDPSSYGHFYISIPRTDEDLSMYDCKKCGAHGVVQPKTLLEWGLYDEELTMYIMNHNKIAFKNVKNYKFKDRDVYFLNNNYIEDTALSNIKLKYINSRIGTNLSFEDLKRLKIILNLNDLLASNRITQLTRHPNIVDQLNESFMGFVSLDNAFVNMRLLRSPGSVYQSIDKRYVNYNIFNKVENTERFYTVPTSLDLTNPSRLKIHIAEGPFDILSILMNLRYDEYGHSIFTSVAGSGYKGLIRHFIVQFKLPYLEIHLYPDNDKLGSDDRMRFIVDDLKPFNFPIFIHRNMAEGQKDFGVDPSKIKEVIYSI